MVAVVTVVDIVVGDVEGGGGGSRGRELPVVLFD